MKLIDAVIQVLEEAEGPLHYREITTRVLDAGLAPARGKTPEATVSARLADELRINGSAARVERVSPGVFRARPSET